MAFVLAIGATALWAFALVVSKPGLAQMGTAAYGFVRPIVAALLVLILALATATLSYPGLPVLGMAILSGFVGMFLGVGLFMYAVKRASAHIAGTLTNIAPLWGAVVSILWLHEQPSLMTLISVGLVVGGVGLLAFQRGRARDEFSIASAVAAVGASAAWGISDTAIAKWCLLHGMTYQTLQFVSLLTAAVCWGLVAIARRQIALRHYPWRGLKYAVATAVIGLFVGSLLWYSALEQVQASSLSPIRGSVVLFVFLWSVALLRERPKLQSLLGSGLILCGIALVFV